MQFGNYDFDHLTLTGSKQAKKTKSRKMWEIMNGQKICSIKRILKTAEFLPLVLNYLRTGDEGQKVRSELDL